MTPPSPDESDPKRNSHKRIRPHLPNRAALRAPGIPEVAARRIPRRKSKVDLSGWSAPELTAYLNAPKCGLEPPRRAGYDAVRIANALSGVLPTEAVLLARAIADAAPPANEYLSPTLQSIVCDYLTDTLVAFRGGGRVATDTSTALVLEQLRLLHRVTGEVQRAEAEHNERELRVQERFLRERFATSQPNPLDLGSDPVGPPRDRMSAPHRPAFSHQPADKAVTPAADLAASKGVAHHQLQVDGDPTALLTPSAKSRDKLKMRLAVPTGIPVTLGYVVERHTGAIEFATSVRRIIGIARRRQSGFGAAQVDVSLEMPTDGLRRFVVYATSRGSATATDAVLFVKGDGESAEMPTLLARRPMVQTTVVASGHDTGEGILLRNESLVFGDLQTACNAYGFTKITWIAPDTPAV